MACVAKKKFRQFLYGIPRKTSRVRELSMMVEGTSSEFRRRFLLPTAVIGDLGGGKRVGEAVIPSWVDLTELKSSNAVGFMPILG